MEKQVLRSGGIYVLSYGGVFAAGFLLLRIPLIRPIVMAFGPPEIFMLIMLGLSYIASLGSGSKLKALISGLIGLLLAMVGFDPQTGDAWYNLQMSPGTKELIKQAIKKYE
jgi:TctA family transporter